MAVRIRYKPNNTSFGKLMMSDQTQDLCDQATRRGLEVAKGLATEAGLPETYIAGLETAAGPPVVLGGNPRRTGRLWARGPLSAVFEFGSGVKRARPQGGRSPIHRILGRTGAIIGNAPTRGTG